MAFSLVKACYILRISYVYVTYILRIWYVIDSGKKGKIQRESKKMAKTWQGKCKEQGEDKEGKESEGNEEMKNKSMKK